jgi:hypothetical protein
MARGHKDDLPDDESEIFLRKGLDRGFAKLADGQIRADEPFQEVASMC